MNAVIKASRHTSGGESLAISGPVSSDASSGIDFQEGSHGLSRMFGALASPDRLAIIRELCAAYRDTEATGEGLSISEVAARTEQSRFQASRNLGILRQSGLVIAERTGPRLSHRLDLRGFEPLEDWIYPVVDLIK